VSAEPIYGPTITIYAERGDVKWLLSAAALAVAIGSGYAMSQNNAPSQDATHVAAYDPGATELLRAGPLPPSAEMILASAAAHASAETRTFRPVRRAQAPAVLEETIGAAPVTDSDEIVVTRARRPIWARTPSPGRLAALYPERARERGREGEASLACIIQAGGALACENVSATPGGFGAAVLRVARRLRHAAQLADGSDAMGVRVNLRVVFCMEEERGRG
jgi:hypothetical protein